MGGKLSFPIATKDCITRVELAVAAIREAAGNYPPMPHQTLIFWLCRGVGHARRDLQAEGRSGSVDLGTLAKALTNRVRSVRSARCSCHRPLCAANCCCRSTADAPAR